MPKIVDHQARRTEIAEAVRRVLLRAGVAGTTVRAVVEESGMSSGAIRHYFANHEQMLQFAAAGIAERVEARIAAALSRQQADPRARATDILQQFLPLDAERVMELSVFTDLAARHPDAGWGERSWTGLRLCARAAVLVLAEAQPRAPEGLAADPLRDQLTARPLRPERWERLAERLHLITDGLSGGQVFYGRRPDADHLTATLRRAVDDVADELARSA